jgi:hypothetical protein
MNLQILRALAAGFLFGLWPVYMHKSNLPGYVGTAVLCGLVFILVLPLLLATQANNQSQLVLPPDWEAVFTAAMLAAMGMIYFNDMLSLAQPKEVGTLIVFAVIMQTTIPAAYDIYTNNGLTLQKAVGFFFAFIAAVLLIKDGS